MASLSVENNTVVQRTNNQGYCFYETLQWGKTKEINGTDLPVFMPLKTEKIQVIIVGIDFFFLL